MKILLISVLLLTGCTGLVHPPLNNALILQVHYEVGLPPHTPNQMREIRDRIQNLIAFYRKESFKYKKECWKVFIDMEMDTGVAVYPLGYDPLEYCNYIAVTTVRKGYPAPEISDIRKVYWPKK